ncbi:hypothetical protein D9M71_202850 [compost metagenome]
MPWAGGLATVAGRALTDLTAAAFQFPLTPRFETLAFYFVQNIPYCFSEISAWLSMFEKASVELFFK